MAELRFEPSHSRDAAVPPPAPKAPRTPILTLKMPVTATLSPKLKQAASKHSPGEGFNYKGSDCGRPTLPANGLFLLLPKQ